MISEHNANNEIAIIDDSLTSLLLLNSYLKKIGFTNVRIFSDSTEGLEWLKNNRWDVALIDLNMPSPDGFEILDELQERDFAESLIIIVSAMNDPQSRLKGLIKGAHDFISKPIELPEALLRIQGCLAFTEAVRTMKSNSLELERKLEDRAARLTESYNSIIRCLGRAVNHRSNETGDHIRRVGELSAILAKAIKMPPIWCDLIRFAAPMHDVGKIGIEDAILQKNSPLTRDEQKSMQRHTLIGYEILRDRDGSAVTDMAAEIALSHHERWDGQGYPNGLKEDAIPLSARIVAICDVYDSLTMPGQYKKSHTHERAKNYIIKQSGRRFDPNLVSVFCKIL